MTTILFKDNVINNIDKLGPKRFEAIETSISLKQPAVLDNSYIGNIVFASCLLTFLDQVSMIGPKRTNDEIKLVMEDYGMGKDGVDEENRPMYSKNLMAGIGSILNHETNKGVQNLNTLLTNTSYS